MKGGQCAFEPPMNHLSTPHELPMKNKINSCECFDIIAKILQLGYKSFCPSLQDKTKLGSLK
jgi:hypothetical protein